jgi:hypothetical protein
VSEVDRERTFVKLDRQGELRLILAQHFGQQ